MQNQPKHQAELAEQHKKEQPWKPERKFIDFTVMTHPSSCDWCTAFYQTNPRYFWLTILADWLFVRVALRHHHCHDDVLETWQVKHTGVLHVGQIVCLKNSWIEWNIPKNKRGELFLFMVWWTKKEIWKYFLTTIWTKIWLFLFTDHFCEVVMRRAATCPRMIMHVWMNRLTRIGKFSRLAGGLKVCSSSLGPPLPITIASRVTRMKSKYRNWKSPKVVLT